MTEPTQRSGNPVGFAIIGTGMIAGFHARALSDVHGSRRVAEFSRESANARALLDKQTGGQVAFSTVSREKALALPVCGVGS